MSSDGWTLLEAFQQVAGPRWDLLIAAKSELRALPTVRHRVRSAGISFWDADAISLQQRQSEILAQRAPVERRVKALWKEIWSALQSEMTSGRWTSTGSREAATSMPAPIYGPGWSQLAVKNLDQGILIERRRKFLIFNVRIFGQASFGERAPAARSKNQKRLSIEAIMKTLSVEAGFASLGEKELADKVLAIQPDLAKSHSQHTALAKRVGRIRKEWSKLKGETS